jgi:integrase
MRRGEVLLTTWDIVDLANRIITMGYIQTKEKRPKRVPMHKMLVQIFDAVAKNRYAANDIVFLNHDGSPPHKDSLTRAW